MLQKLQKGDLIDIVSPASPVTFEELKEIQEYLAQKGFKSRYFLREEIAIEMEMENKFPASSGKARFDQLKMAMESPDSSAIWCSNGGYGSADLLEYLHASEKITQTKQFIGFSDITSLATFFRQNWSWETIYGPMLNQLAGKKLQKQSEDAIFELILAENDGKIADFWQKLEIKTIIGKKEVSGELIGGCVSVLAHDLATKNQINWDGKILLLEDIEEKGEKLDRLFTQFLAIMTESNSCPKAIIFGNFYEFIEDENLKSNIRVAVANFIQNISRKSLNISVFIENNGFLGHGLGILPVIIGKDIVIANNTISH